MSAPGSVAAVVARALDAYDALGLLGEEIEDEWTYVTDLGATWRRRLEEVVAARGDDPLDAASATAVDTAIEEIALIEDPNRAIDWLSTFPQVVLLAVGEAA